MLAGGSGRAVARLYHRVLAAIFAVAWLSLLAQVGLLVGSRGLLPAAPLIEALRSQDAPFRDVPTIFLWIAPTGGALHGLAVVGVALSVLAFAGVAPRLCLGLATVLYLGYAIVGRTFFGFQWDNLLLECGMLATLLPRGRRAPWVHFLFRVLLFKLYFESGIAKWGSYLHDWHDGSAMTFYYETAPLPARLAWYAHALPAAWHHFESWFTLFFELVVPFAIFLPRRGRLAALVVLTVFQIVNLATANYGFFVYLALALHLFLLDDRDVIRARSWALRRAPLLGRLRARQRWLDLVWSRAVRRALGKLAPSPDVRRWAAVGAVGVYLAVSLADAAATFSGSRTVFDTLAPLRERVSPFRVVNTYHLFGAITRERIEPELQTFDGATWTAHDLWYKPGDVMRAPGFVAPHQPRVDFQLWFYGLSYRSGPPPYVRALLDRACHDPTAVDALFREPLPRHPAAVRMAFFRYHFTTPDERRATGAFWKRTWEGATPPVTCGVQAR